MKKLLIGILLILLPSMAFAAPKRVEIHELTIGGTAMKGTVVATNNTVTSDSVYISGNIGYTSLVTTVTGGIKITYQVSADNATWYTPFTTNTIGTVTSAGTIDSLMATNTWISAPWTIAPYIRFSYASTGQSTIDSMVLWQDES